MGFVNSFLGQVVSRTDRNEVTVSQVVLNGASERNLRIRSRRLDSMASICTSSAGEHAITVTATPYGERVPVAASVMLDDNALQALYMELHRHFTMPSVPSKSLSAGVTPKISEPA